MQITLNNTPMCLTKHCTLTQLLQQQELKVEGLAIAINNVVIAKTCWNEHKLQNHDDIQLFQIVTGG